MAYRIDIPRIGQVFTALTIDSSCTPAERSLNKYTGVTVGNQWDEIINGDHVSLENTYLKLESSTNSTAAVREGYGLIMYMINGQRCENILHVVQEASYVIYITLTGNMSGRYSDYVTFVLSNGFTYQANYSSTSGAFSDKAVVMDIPSGDLTITGVSVTDSRVAHMGYPAQLVSGSDTILKNGGRYTINVT